MENLYVSDLDGTLLNNRQEITLFSSDNLNKLIDSGLNFTIATARTPATVVDIISNLNIKLPLILMNGVIIYDKGREEYIDIKEIDNQTVFKVLDVLDKGCKNYLVYAINQNHMYVYYKKFFNEAEIDFYNGRKDRKLKTFVKTDDYRKSIKNSKIINIVVMDKEESIDKINNKLDAIGNITVNYYEDIYNPSWYFMEIYNSTASKAKGIEFVSNYLKSQNLITFGDNLNDIPMFLISDRCYAMENADKRLKEISTAVIGNNNDDAVVKFLLEDIEK